MEGSYESTNSNMYYIVLYCIVLYCIILYCIVLYCRRVGGLSPCGCSPTGKSFRFVRACERARRGEAAWASERRFDHGAGPVSGKKFPCCCSSSGRLCAGLSGCPVVRLSGGFSLKTNVFFQHLLLTTRGQPSKTNVC